MATHAGSILNEKSKAGRLFRVLKKRPGRRWSTFDLALKLSDPCVHTTVHEVRAQLDKGWRLVSERMLVKERVRWVYALVKSEA